VQQLFLYIKYFILALIQSVERMIEEFAEPGSGMGDVIM
jgi:hypothetical protein